MFDYIFMGGDEPAGSGIPAELLRTMRREFEYWYPFDLRVSGKDLIQASGHCCLLNSELFVRTLSIFVQVLA